MLTHLHGFVHIVPSLIWLANNLFFTLHFRSFNKITTKNHESESEAAHSCLTLCNPMDSSLHQAPPSMGFSRQEYWSGLPLPSPGHLPDPGIKPRSPTLQTEALPSEPPKNHGHFHNEALSDYPRLSFLMFHYSRLQYNYNDDVYLYIFSKCSNFKQLTLEVIMVFGFILLAKMWSPVHGGAPLECGL